jgi:Na+/phosphate symporter
MVTQTIYDRRQLEQANAKLQNKLTIQNKKRTQKQTITGLLFSLLDDAIRSLVKRLYTFDNARRNQITYLQTNKQNHEGTQWYTQ